MDAISGGGADGGISGYELMCRVESVRVVSSLLQSMAFKKDQIILLELTPEGICFTTEDSKCVQAKALLKRELFGQYQFRSQDRLLCFSVGLSHLLDCLSLYGSASADITSLHMCFPGTDNTLVILFVFFDSLTL